jgi:hypothetical protein
VLEATLQDEDRSSRLLHDHLTKLLRDLAAKEGNLLDLAEGGRIAAAKVRSRLEAIAQERAKTQADLAAEGPRLEAGVATIRAALDYSMTRKSFTGKPAMQSGDNSTKSFRLALPRRLRPTGRAIPRTAQPARLPTASATRPAQ